MVISDSEQAGNKSNVLAYLVNEARYTLVIPSSSDTWSSDPLVASAVEAELMSSRKIVPLYPDESYVGRSPILDTRVGVCWSGSVGHSIGKERFTDSLKK